MRERATEVPSGSFRLASKGTTWLSSTCGKVLGLHTYKITIYVFFKGAGTVLKHFFNQGILKPLSSFPSAWALCFGFSCQDMGQFHDFSLGCLSCQNNQASYGEAATSSQAPSLQILVIYVHHLQGSGHG